MLHCFMKRYSSHLCVFDIDVGNTNGYQTNEGKRLSMDTIIKMKDDTKLHESTEKTNSGIVHIGAGNFHRSHQESYLNELLAHDFEHNKNWLYTGISVLETDAELQRNLKRNMYKYHIISIDPNGMTKVEEIKTLKDLVLTSENLLSALSLICDEKIKIVSLTITEPGYATELNDYDGKLIQSCLSNKPLSYEGTVTAFGIIIAGLARRYSLGLRPFTLMSCDNLIKNGDVCRKKCLTAVSSLNLSDDFKEWMKNEVRYPNTMVDRITPYLSKDEIVDLEKKFSLIDQSPVVCESYKSWVIEDNFVDNQRPSWEKVGTVMTDDVEPYEFIKIFLLNVPHSCIAYAGLNKKYEYVHEAIGDPEIHDLLNRMIIDEVFPILQRNIGEVIDWKSYYVQTIKRFKNSHVKDRLDRIARDGLEKLKKQGVKLLKEGIRHGIEMNNFKKFLDMWLSALNVSHSDVFPEFT